MPRRPVGFGFCMAMHPAEPDTVYILPIDSDGSAASGGKLRVYRTRGPYAPGTDDQAFRRDAFETISATRWARTASTPAALFRARSGKLFASPTRALLGPSAEGCARRRRQAASCRRPPLSRRSAGRLMPLEFTIPARCVPLRGGNGSLGIPRPVTEALETSGASPGPEGPRFTRGRPHPHALQPFVNADNVRDLEGLRRVPALQIAILPAVSGDG